jgi:hypothetical protein
VNVFSKCSLRDFACLTGLPVHLSEVIFSNEEKARQASRYACVNVQVKNIDMLSGRFFPLPLYNQSKEWN